MIYRVCVLLEGVGLILPVLIRCAILTLSERIHIASVHHRMGPVTNFLGILQPFRDAVKLISKILPDYVEHHFLQIASPLTMLIINIFSWYVLPVGEGVVKCQIFIDSVFLMGIRGLSVFSLIFGG